MGNDEDREQRRAIVAELKARFEFDTQARDVRSHWGLLAVGKTVELRTSHRTLSLDAVAQVLREDMLEFCYSRRYRFPLRDESGVLLFPYVNEPRLVERARKVVLADLCSGALEATATDARNPVERVKINAEVWPALDVDFERNAARTESFAFLDIKVSIPAITTTELLPSPRQIADEEVRKWLLDQLQRRDPKTPWPSAEADRKAAEADLDGRIDRRLFRQRRKEIIPTESLPKRGRRRAAASTQPSPSGARRGPYRR